MRSVKHFRKLNMILYRKIFHKATNPFFFQVVLQARKEGRTACPPLLIDLSLRHRYERHAQNGRNPCQR